MIQDVAEPPAQFDLSEASANLWPFTLHKRRALIGAVGGLVAFALFFILLDAHAIASRSLAGFQAIDLLIVLGGVIAILVCTGVVTAILRLKKGALLLRVDNLGFDLVYPNGATIRTLWGDPSLSFDLLDLSDINPTKLGTGPPYSIMVRGVQSLLTSDAFTTLVGQARRHGLHEAITRGSRWIYSSDANPLIHRIRATRHVEGLNQ
jgi:hypothetical protein